MTPGDEQPIGWKVSNMLLGKSEGQLLIAPERMKWMGQSRNDAQLWMRLVVKAKSNAAENNTAKEPGMLGPYSTLDVVKQEMARVNIDILGTSELKWMRIGEFNLDDHYIYYCEKEFLRRNGVALIANRRVQTAVFG